MLVAWVIAAGGESGELTVLGGVLETCMAGGQGFVATGVIPVRRQRGEGGCGAGLLGDGGGCGGGGGFGAGQGGGAQGCREQGRGG
ncbi:hypothetical protein C1I98_34130 [Spongiactinospora gelatinilytica]|uniref:Uncharacterized protein n=1 Tax=Spongiactinospora gelatinilytica TaxID=2666298 RepID=A0A2W2FWA3_9ACTN|nr:hypothetical protein C1I98_34130 [Spongiactinospora gelatinilytica]